MQLVCSKVFQDIPFAHRQFRHDGHCALIHGHNWSFKFTFTCDVVDENNFIVDFGKMQWLKSFLTIFDHACIFCEDDPRREVFEEMQKEKIMRCIFLRDCSCEGLAQFLMTQVNALIVDIDSLADRGVRLIEVTVFEDSKNSATCSAE